MKAVCGCRCLDKERETPSMEGSPSSAQSSARSGTNNQQQFLLLDCKARAGTPSFMLYAPRSALANPASSTRVEEGEAHSFDVK